MPVRGTSGSLFNRRQFLTRLAASGAALGLLTACGGTTTPVAPAPAATSETRLNVPQSISTAGAAPPAAPQAGPTAAPAPGKPQPTGQFNYAGHTTISPAWFDPQENPPQITPYNFAYALHDALVKHL